MYDLECRADGKWLFLPGISYNECEVRFGLFDCKLICAIHKRKSMPDHYSV